MPQESKLVPDISYKIPLLTRFLLYEEAARLCDGSVGKRNAAANQATVEKKAAVKAALCPQKNNTIGREERKMVKKKGGGEIIRASTHMAIYQTFGESALTHEHSCASFLLLLHCIVIVVPTSQDDQHIQSTHLFLQE